MHSFQPSLTANLQQLRQELGFSPDLRIREWELGEQGIRVAVAYTNNLIDMQIVSEFILRSLSVFGTDDLAARLFSPDDTLLFIKSRAVKVGEVRETEDWTDLAVSVVSGDTAILIDGCVKAVVCGTRGGEWRSISEPTTEVTIRGPKDSFNESIATNITLLRRRIMNPDLWLETMKIGNVTKTDVAVMYIKGVADENIVQEVKRRLKEVKLDSVLESGYIEELIQDQTFTPFPTMYNSERPDVVAKNLLEGRVAVLVNGTPFVLIVPTVLAQFFESAEDYYQRYDISSFLRLIRYISFLISLLVPSIYIAGVTFHQDMIPTSLLFSLAASREGVPFPALVEALIMEVTFELLREAGIRLPRAVGQAVSIVGALVLGQAAVQAGIVSPAMVIVVAITGIASFAIPAYNLAISARLIRFLFMILSASFGFYALTLGMIVLTAHLCSLRSFGVPYLTPFAPFLPSEQKDTVVRFPLWSLFTRVRMIQTKKDKGLEGEPDEQ